MQQGMTRRQLYERVWSTPMKRLAPELGLSDVGLAKLCRRANIPVPPRGYWARLAFGKAVQRIALPNPTSNTEVIWHDSMPRTSRTSRWDALLARLRDLPPIVVRDAALRDPLVLETERQLKKGVGRAAAPTGILRIEVSAGATHRALLRRDRFARTVRPTRPDSSRSSTI